MDDVIRTTLGELSYEYGVECPFDPETIVILWRGEDDTVQEGWHITTQPDLELLDENWAPRSDAHARSIAFLHQPIEE